MRRANANDIQDLIVTSIVNDDGGDPFVLAEEIMDELRDHGYVIMAEVSDK